MCQKQYAKCYQQSLVTTVDSSPWMIMTRCIQEQLWLNEAMRVQYVKCYQFLCCCTIIYVILAYVLPTRTSTAFFCTCSICLAGHCLFIIYYILALCNISCHCMQYAINSCCYKNMCIITKQRWFLPIHHITISVLFVLRALVGFLCLVTHEFC